MDRNISTNYTTKPLDAFTRHYIEKTQQTAPIQKYGYALAGDVYDNYSQQITLDRSPDAPFLPHEEPRRPALSTHVLNMRYTGNRSGYYDVRHPDMFVGFLEQDDRGKMNNNDPSFTKYREHTNKRTNQFNIRAGYNTEGGDESTGSNIPERPLFGAQLNEHRQQEHINIKRRAKIFETSKHNNEGKHSPYIPEQSHPYTLTKTSQPDIDSHDRSRTNQNILSLRKTKDMVSSVIHGIEKTVASRLGMTPIQSNHSTSASIMDVTHSTHNRNTPTQHQPSSKLTYQSFQDMQHLRGREASVLRGKTKITRPTMPVGQFANDPHSIANIYRGNPKNLTGFQHAIDPLSADAISSQSRKIADKPNHTILQQIASIFDQTRLNKTRSSADPPVPTTHTWVSTIIDRTKTALYYVGHQFDDSPRPIQTMVSTQHPTHATRITLRRQNEINPHIRNTTNASADANTEFNTFSPTSKTTVGSSRISSISEFDQDSFVH